MNQRSVFHLISNLTQKEGIPCILIGGFAVNHYKVTRQTADIDFLITKEDFDKISAVLKKAGYKPTSARETFVQMKSSQLSLLDVDFMFVDHETLEKILKQAREIKIAGQKFTVPSLYHLIALKLHSIKHNEKIRFTKDFPDIINLIRINNVNVKDGKFKELCLKYGTEKIYDQIAEIVQ